MSEEEFKRVYNQIVNKTVIDELEVAKIEMKNNGKYKTTLAISFVMLLVILLGTIAVVEALQVNEGLVFFILVIILGVGLSGIYIIYSKIEWKDTYGQILRSKIVEPFEKLIYEGYTYIPKDGISENTFKNLKLYQFNEYTTSKLLCGSLKHNCKFKMANVQAVSSSWDCTGEVVHPYEKVTFSGICIEIEITNALKSNLYLKRKNRSFTKTAKELNLCKSKGLIENKQFDKMYEIYTNDTEVANKILKEDIIQKLLKYYEKTKQQCEIVIQGNHTYITSPETYMFDIILYEGEETYKKALENYKRVNFIFELVNTIIDEIYY